MVSFFPFLFWVLPHKVYQLTREQAERIREPIVEEKKTRSYFWFIMGSTVIVKPLLAPLLEKSISSSIAINSMIIVGYTIAMLFFRVRYLKYQNQQLSQKIKLQDLETQKIKISPKYFRQFINPIWMFLFLILLLFMTGYVFIIDGVFFGILLYLIFLPTFFMPLFIFYNPDMGKDDQYQVSLVE